MIRVFPINLIRYKETLFKKIAIAQNAGQFIQKMGDEPR
jgi:hypothetical protein